MLIYIFRAFDRRPSQCHSGHMCLSVLMISLALLGNGALGELIAKCPSGKNEPTRTAPYCQCNTGSTQSGAKVTIICDFGNKEDVVLTEDLYPFRRENLMLAYVRVKNATSVKVTEGFLGAIQSSPSVTLDFWRGGTLILASSPERKQAFPPSFNTYIAVGIINCTVPTIPSRFLQDRKVGLLIRGSRIGTISKGSLFDVTEVRYLVIEDSLVERIESKLSNKAEVSLKPVYEDKWQAFRIFNATLPSISSEAFSFVNKANTTWEAKIVNNRFGDVGPGAISVVGQMDITIQGNTFQRLQKDALKVNVTGALKFDENVVNLLEPGGLMSLLCGKSASMEKNTVHLRSPKDKLMTASSIPFEASCGNPQMFVVMSPPEPLKLTKTSKATWVLLTLLLLFVCLLAFVGLYTWKNQTFFRQYRRGVVPLRPDIASRTTFNELHNSVELDVSVDTNSSDTGVSNPVYEIREPS